MRSAQIKRKTAETDIELKLCLDGSGKADVESGIGFLDHMLTLFAVHSRFDLYVRCKGDTQVDDHHSAEDIAIALGQAFAQALGDKKGITRYGSCILPMDEALVLTAVDISGRAHIEFDLPVLSQKVGSFDTELVEEFWTSFARNAGVTLHIKKLNGTNTHHIIEGCFKSAARSLRAAAAPDPAFAGVVPSSKEVL